MSNRKYTEEFKAEAIKQVTVRGYKVKEVCERLGLARVFICCCGWQGGEVVRVRAAIKSLDRRSLSYMHSFVYYLKIE